MLDHLENQATYLYSAAALKGKRMCIQNLKTLTLIEDGKFVTENLLGEKEKWTNKENDMQQHADSLLHNTTNYIQHLYQNFKILGAVVPEKSLIQISICITLG